MSEEKKIIHYSIEIYFSMSKETLILYTKLSNEVHVEMMNKICKIFSNKFLGVKNDHTNKGCLHRLKKMFYIKNVKKISHDTYNQKIEKLEIKKKVIYLKEVWLGVKKSFRNILYIYNDLYGLDIETNLPNTITTDSKNFNLDTGSNYFITKAIGCIYKILRKTNCTKLELEKKLYINITDQVYQIFDYCKNAKLSENKMIPYILTLNINRNLLITYLVDKIPLIV
jgi:hypothetical protein